MSSQWLKISTGEPPVDPSPPITFPFTLDVFQQHAIGSIAHGENVLVTAPTGAGKTCVCLYAMADANRRGKRVIYTSPIKSLSNQKFKEFKNYPNVGDVGILTGDIKFNPTAQCIIMTTEILRNLLYNDGKIRLEVNKPEIRIDISEVGCVIFDEVHYINDRDRGKVWEECIIMLPPEIVLVMLSATIDKPERFASWIGNLKHKPINLVQTSFRPVPLSHWLYIHDPASSKKQLYPIMNHSNAFLDTEFDTALRKYRDGFKDTTTGQIRKIKGKSSQQINVMMKYIQYESRKLDHLFRHLEELDLFPALVFSFSRRNCEIYAKSLKTNLITPENRSEIENIFNHHMHSYMRQYEKLAQFTEIRNLLFQGIGVHHSGLVPILKEIVEILFAKSLIKVLFCTETFAVGVNMPTRTVVFTELEKYDGMYNRRRLLRTDEYLQMAGRAGRRGLDKVGTVIHFPIRELPTKQELKNIMSGRSPEINSQFTLNYGFILKVTNSEAHNLIHFIQNSLLNAEQQRKIAQLREELSRIEPAMAPDNLPETPEMKEYRDINNILSSGFSIKPKELKRLRARLHDLTSAAQFREELALLTTTGKVSHQIQSLRTDIKSLEDENVDNLHRILSFLSKTGFIELLQEDQPKLCLKGLLASHISECNEILLTEMLVDGHFQDLEVDELAGVLAIFVDDGKSDMDGMSRPSIEIYTPSVRRTLDSVQHRANDLEQLEHQFGITCLQTDWRLYDELVVPAMLWCRGEPLTEIYKTTDIYEGNFIRGILKISHIAETLVTLAEIVNDAELAKRAEQVSKALIRDEVTVNSLYI